MKPRTRGGEKLGIRFYCGLARSGSPKRKIVAVFTDDKRAKSAEDAATATLADAAGSVVGLDKKAPQAGAAQAPAKKIDLGTIALIGTAIGGVSALVSGILQAIFSLGFWLPAGLVGIVLLISGPSMILASLKLRKRDLSPLLEANGWAINTRALVNIPFGATMTNLAVLLVVLGLAVAWALGAFDSFLPASWSFESVWAGLRQVRIQAPDIPKVEALVPKSAPPSASP
jgi:hypothetical protein